jgi:hypothetical protein
VMTCLESAKRVQHNGADAGAEPGRLFFGSSNAMVRAEVHEAGAPKQYVMRAEAGDGLGVEGTVTASEVGRELWSLGGVRENLERQRSGALVVRSHVRDRGRSRRWFCRVSGFPGGPPLG